MLEEEVFRFFWSPGRIDGQDVKMGVDESRKLKERAIYRNLLAADGSLARPLSWTEQLLVVMRDATTGEGMNHEWWGAETIRPIWANRLDLYYRESWLYKSHKPEHLTARSIGEDIGWFLTLNERRVSFILTDPHYLAEFERSELERARRGKGSEAAGRMRIAIAGYSGVEELARETQRNALDLRRVVFEIATKQAVGEFSEFTAGFVVGAERAAKVDFSDELSEYSEQQDVVRILDRHWDEIEAMQSRSEIARFILAHLPVTRKENLERYPEQFETFKGRLRDIFRKIELKTERGRPKKKQNSKPYEPQVHVIRIEYPPGKKGSFDDSDLPIITEVPGLAWVREFNRDRFKDKHAETGTHQS